MTNEVHLGIDCVVHILILVNALNFNQLPLLVNVTIGWRILNFCHAVLLSPYADLC